MARKRRLESSDGLYHVINRGNYRADVFGTEGAKKSFAKTLEEACEKFNWGLSAYCLMSNHFHLCLATPSGNLSVGMRWLQATFAMRFNKYRKEHGHLFQGRFKSLLVEPGQHWLDLVDYIHLNPVRAGLSSVDGIGRYPWTSLNRFPKRKGRPSRFDCSWMDYFEDYDDSRGGWARYISHLKLKYSDDPQEIEELDRKMCRGWGLGSSDFKQAVADDLARDRSLARLEREDLAELNRSRWDSALGKCMDLLGKNASNAAEERLSAAWKLAIASKLKRESSVTNAWLSDRLNMGKPRSVSAICGRYARDREGACQWARRLKKLIIDH
jgi:REP element-mobilizing transposase RayT